MYIPSYGGELTKCADQAWWYFLDLEFRCKMNVTARHWSRRKRRRLRDGGLCPRQSDGWLRLIPRRMWLMMESVTGFVTRLVTAWRSSSWQAGGGDTGSVLSSDVSSGDDEHHPHHLSPSVNTPSEVSKQFASNSLCLASVVAVEDWWLLLLIEYNIKCRQSMCVCIPVVSRLQCYTRHTKTRLTLITRVQASLNAKWTYPLFIQPAIVRGIVFVCLSNSHSTPFDLVYHVTCVLIFPVSSKIKAVRGLGVMGRRVLGGRGWGSHSGDIYCYGTICTKARQSIRMKHIRLIGIATPSTAAQYWK